MAKKKLSYNEAISELEEIVSELENEKIEVDELSQKVQRVSDLLKLCKTKLHDTEQGVQKILEEIEQ